MLRLAELHPARRLNPRGTTYPFLTFTSEEIQDLLNLLQNTTPAISWILHSIIEDLLYRNKNEHHATCLTIEKVTMLYDHLDAESKKPDNTHRQNQLETLKQKLQIASSLDPVATPARETSAKARLIIKLIIDGNFGVLTLLTASTNSEEYSYAQLAHDFGWLDLSVAIALMSPAQTEGPSDHCLPDPYARDRLDRICVMVFLIAGQARGPILTRMLTSIRSHESDPRHHLLFAAMHLAGAHNDFDLCYQIITAANVYLNNQEQDFRVTQYEKYLSSHASIKPLAFWAIIYHWSYDEDNPLTPYFNNRIAIKKTAQMLLRWHQAETMTRRFLNQHSMQNTTITTAYSAIDCLVENMLRCKDIKMNEDDINAFAHLFHTVDATSQLILLHHLWAKKCFMPLAAFKPDPSLMAYLHLLIGPEQRSLTEIDSVTDAEESKRGAEESKHNNNHPSPSIDIQTHQRLAILCKDIIHGPEKLSQQDKHVLSNPLLPRIDQCLRNHVFHKLYAVSRPTSDTTQSKFKNIPGEVLQLIFAGLDPAATWHFGCTSRYALLTLPKMERLAFIEKREHLTSQLTQTECKLHKAIDHKATCNRMILLILYYTIACLIYLGENHRFHLDPGEDFPWTRAGVPIASALAMGFCCLLVKRYHASFSQQEYIDIFIHRNAEVDARVSGPESICSFIGRHGRSVCSFIGRHGRSVHKRKYFILCYEVIACSALINVVTSLSLHHDTYKKENSGYIKNGPGFALGESIVLGLPLLYMATWGMISFFTPSEDVLTFNRQVNEARQALDTHLGLSNASETKPPELPLQAANERSDPTEPLLVTVEPFEVTVEPFEVTVEPFEVTVEPFEVTVEP
jgi:hypothetical protein